MKKMTKLLAVCLAAVLVFGSAVTVFAAGSPDTSTAETSADGIAAVTADGVKVTVTAASQADFTSAKKAAASLGLSGAEVKRVFELNATIDKPTNITISVPGITAGQGVVVLHQKSNGKWESVTVVKVSNGSVTATFTSLSPVAIVTYTKNADKTTTTTNSTTSPKTGEAFPVAGAISLLALFGAVVCFRKYEH